MLRRMSIGQLRMCADPERSPLDESQQISFDAAYGQLGREMADRIIRPVLQAKTMPHFELALPTNFPRIRYDDVSKQAFEALNAQSRASVERMVRRFNESLSAAQSIGVDFSN